MAYNRFDITLPGNEKSEEALHAILFQYEEIIHELIDEMKKINYDFNPIGEIAMYLGLTQDEQYILMQKLSISKESVEKKIQWLDQWLKENIFECPEEYVKKIVYTYSSIESVIE